MTNIEVTTCYSNKFKNKKTPNHNDVFSMKAGQIETQRNAEKQKEINYETKGNGKYIEDGMLNTHTFKKSYIYADAMIKANNIPDRYKECPTKKHR